MKMLALLLVCFPLHAFEARDALARAGVDYGWTDQRERAIELSVQREHQRQLKYQLRKRIICINTTVEKAPSGVTCWPQY